MNKMKTWRDYIDPSAKLVTNWRNGEHKESKTNFELGRMMVLLKKIEKL